MATITPDEGLEFTTDKLLADASIMDWEMFQISVGTGAASLSSTDTQLDNEIFRADKDDSIVSITDASANGKITAKITISGGTEVPAGTDVTEFAIFAIDPNDRPTDDTTDGKDIMLHRELRNAVTIGSGDRKTFQIEYFAETR